MECTYFMYQQKTNHVCHYYAKFFFRTLIFSKFENERLSTAENYNNDSKHIINIFNMFHLTKFDLLNTFNPNSLYSFE